MTIRIKVRNADLDRVRIELTTSDNRTFYMDAKKNGLAFYASVNSAENPEGNPIVKTADDVFAWIGNEGAGKPFRKRKGVQPKGGDK